jgi:hypothetical protein
VKLYLLPEMCLNYGHIVWKFDLSKELTTLLKPGLMKYGFRVICDAQSSLENFLSTVLCNGVWSWRPARSDDLVDIQSRLLDVNIRPCDKPIWSISKKKIYMSSDTWEMIRKKNPIVDWWQLVWFPLAIPEQVFVLWLGMKNCLTTGDCLAKWGYKGNVTYMYCQNGMESRGHLFFSAASVLVCGRKL